mgnify:CR=1 FL=1|jgi:DNA polymerase elongation subunit (family B)
MVETIEPNDVSSMLKSGELKFYNFYNSDLNMDAYYAVEHYTKNPKDSIDTPQTLHTVFADIELYVGSSEDFDTYKSVINAITSYSNIEKIYNAYILLTPDNYKLFGVVDNMSETDYNNLLVTRATEFRTELLKTKHIKEDEEIKVHIYTDEKKMLIDCWMHIRELDPTTLSGFNSDFFDYPYYYNRLLILHDGDKREVDSIMSQFKHVTVKGSLLKFPEFVICDIMYLYKPRSEGGANYGSVQPSYSLDYISTEELGLQKLDYKSQNMTLNDFYMLDPIHFLLYNIIDTALTARLDEKLQHIELHNNIRRAMKAPFAYSMIGSSALFDCHVLGEINKNNSKVRHGMSSENSKGITLEQLEGIPHPITKKGKLAPVAISKDEYGSITSKYDGAYVKNSISRIIANGSLILDLDATSLYPSMMLQSNISFDVYRARVLPPTTTKVLQLLEKTLGRSNYPPTLMQNIFSLVNDYVDNNDITPKEKNKKSIYYTACYLIKNLYNSKIEIDRIFNPTTDQETILLNQNLIPLLDILNTIHPQRESYNKFIYDYFFDDTNINKNYDEVHIIKDIHTPHRNIVKVSVDEAISFIKGFSLTITGTCFLKHEEQLGLFSQMLKDMIALRKVNKGLRDNYDEGTAEYSMYDGRQLSYKILVNSSYGITGLKSFRYSGHHLAQAITTQGRLSLKSSTYLAEEYLKNNYA